MSKNAFFIGQPIFSQIIKLIPRWIIDQAVIDFNSDRYVKKFKTYDHLVSMLYCCFSKCNSIREVIIGLEVGNNKLQHLGLTHTPRRSTLSDANRRRTEKVFEFIFHKLVSHYFPHLSDSSKAKSIEDKLFLMDSTTITLFSEVMKGAGSYKNNGRKKGGVKAHVLSKAKEDAPVFVRITEGKEHDLIFMSDIRLPKGSFLVFDKAYTNSRILHKWDEQEISWVTRINKRSKIMFLSKLDLSEDDENNGIFNDQMIKVGRRSNKSTKEMILRLVSMYDFEKGRVFHFLTNNFDLSASEIAELYKRRWQIELMFKRWKSNSPLKSFLGDNPNAIKIQLWCSIICDLLVQVIRIKLRNLKSRWSFSNLSGLIRQHLFTYTKLFEMLKRPERLLLQSQENRMKTKQLELFSSA